jgi:excisionase family DNA binding protein
MQIMHFTPPQIAKYFAVNESTIKRWILSGKLQADSTPGGHYRVSKEQMNEFLSSHKKYTSSYVLNRLLKQKETEKLNWKEYYDSIYKNNTYKAISILRTLYLSGQSLAQIFDQVIIPSLGHIGVEWMEGRLEINMEHRMSFVVSQHIGVLADFIPENKKKKLPEAILACVPGNTHILPMFMGDAILKQYNFKREVLGINISIDELERAIKRKKDTKLVCISKTYSPIDSQVYLKKLLHLSKEKKFKLVFSGQGWTRAELAILKKNLAQQVTTLIGFENYLKTLI